MRKKLGIWLALLMVFTQSTMVLYAKPQDSSVIEAVSGYCLGDELYEFLNIDEGYDIESFRVNLQSDNLVAESEALVEPITDTSSIVRYVFMVDLTGSMRNYIEDVNAFIDSLTENEQQESVFTVATFGECFQIAKENLTDKNAVTKALRELQYTERLTDPYTGIESALTYLDTYSRRSGDLINLVVITDGEPDLGIADAKENKKKSDQLSQSAKQKIEKTPEVIVSSLCTKEWEKQAFETISVGNGIHETIHGIAEAKRAGKDLATHVDQLYRTCIKLAAPPQTERFSVDLRIKGNNGEGQLAFLNVSQNEVPNLKAFSNDGAGDDAQEKLPEIVDPNAESEKATESTESIEETETIESTESVENTEVTEPTEAIVDKRDLDGNESTKLNPVILGAVVLGILILLILVFALLKKKPGTKVPENAIAMRLEIRRGNCKNKDQMLYLVDKLTIGSSADCDIVFGDSSVAPKNSVIILKDQMIYIEDLNSPQGTAIGGMRIQGRNRLRGGDVITIGNVEFSLKF